MDFRPNIASFQTGVYAVTRRAARVMIKGRAQGFVTSTLNVTASVQQASGRDLMVAPEGNWSGEVVKIYTDTELLVQGATNEADLVTYRGATFEVRTCERWDDLGKYFKVLAVRIPDAA